MNQPISEQNVSARNRLLQLFDAGTFTEFDRLAQNGDDPVPVVCGYGLINDAPVYAFAQDETVCNGVMGTAHAQKIHRVYKLAAQNGAPVVGMFGSDGVCLDDGIAAMDAVSDILSCANELSGVVPQVAVIAASCVGSAALIAGVADVIVAVDGTDLYLTRDEKVAADITVDTVEDAVAKVREFLDYLPSNNLSAPVVYGEATPAAVASQTSTDAAAMIADDQSLFTVYADGGVQTALARVNGVSCGIVTLAEETVHTVPATNAARFVRFCDAFSLPVITVVDAAAFSSVRGASRLSQAYSEATTAKITLIAGKAYGTVYIAVAGKRAGADAVLAWDGASVAPLAPETAIHIVWNDRLAQMQDPAKDRAALAEEYRLAECNAYKAAAQGGVTDVIAPEQSRASVAAFMEMMAGKRVSKLPKKHANIRL